MSIYTKTGDNGTTAVYGGKRISKGDPQVEAYGSIDELNSVLGLIISYIPKTNSMRTFFISVQEDLMSIGSVLAGWNGNISPLENRVKQMERTMDIFGSELPTLTNFILPGGSPIASQMHITRSVCRRTERTIVRLTKAHRHYAIIAKYLNRLSDFLFMYARVINKKTRINEVQWKGIQ
jgi:cob(I)alamin adenosyltransferase